MNANSPPTATASPRKRKQKLLLLGSIAILALAGGGVALRARRSSAAVSQAEGSAHEPNGPPGVLALDPFVLNLADAGRERYVRATIALAIDDAEKAERIGADALVQARLRDAILTLLSALHTEELQSAADKESLRVAILHAVSPLVTDATVTEVYITELLVQ